MGGSGERPRPDGGPRPTPGGERGAPHPKDENHPKQSRAAELGGRIGACAYKSAMSALVLERTWSGRRPMSPFDPWKLPVGMQDEFQVIARRSWRPTTGKRPLAFRNCLP